MPQALKLGRAGPISCAWAGAGCPWASLGSAKMVGLPVLMSASFPSFHQPALLPLGELPSLSAPLPRFGGGTDMSSTHPHGTVARASPMMLSPGQVPSQPWSGQHHSRHKTRGAPPSSSRSIPRASSNLHPLLHPPWIYTAPRTSFLMCLVNMRPQLGCL